MLPILNFVVLDEKQRIYRGGQPVGADAWNILKSLRVWRVVKLNDGEGDQVWSMMGRELFKVPVSATEQILTEPDEQWLLDAAGFIGPRTFVHCQHGQDRTGLVVAMWRVLKCGWTCGRAEDEMFLHGFHRSLLGLWKAWDHFRDKQMATV